MGGLGIDTLSDKNLLSKIDRLLKETTFHEDATLMHCIEVDVIKICSEYNIAN